MKWIVEYMENENMLKLRKTLDEKNIDYLLIQADNLNKKIDVLNKEYLLKEKDSQILFENFIKNDKVFCYGTKYMSEIINKQYPEISFQDNLLDCQYLPYYFGSCHILNNDMLIGDLFLLEPKNNSFFIRPLGNNKLINGQVMTKEEFNKLKENERNKLNSKFINKPLIISSLKQIKEEYRFFVYNKKIIASSSYNPSLYLDVNEDIIKFVEKMIERFPLKNYVIDIALTDDDKYKIIELNNINTSGLYNINMHDFVNNIN